MNGNKIVTAFRENLDNRHNIIKMEKVVGTQFDTITALIGDIKSMYLIVFKNLSSKKEFVCKIDDIYNPRTRYYYNDADRSKPKEVLLFLNNEGFSIGQINHNDKGEEVIDDKSATRHIHQYGDDKDFIRALLRLVKYKNEIWAKIKMPIKKERFSKFTKAFEDNQLDKTFDYNEDYHYFTEDFNKAISYYRQDKICEEFIKKLYIETHNPSSIHQIRKRNGGYSSSEENIQLDDMEKVEQIYDEVVAFLQRVADTQEILKNNLQNFKDRLINDFAKELIIAKMDKEAKEDKK